MNLYEQNINRKQLLRTYCKPNRLPNSQKAEIDRQIIEESHSKGASPILLVLNKADSNENKKWRVVIWESYLMSA